jgi:hypothetical protein
MVTPKGYMLTEGQTFQISVQPYRFSICPHLVTRQMSNLAILANSNTQNSFLFPVHAMFSHDCLLAVKPASTPRRLVYKKNLEIFFIYWYVLFCCVCLGCCAADFESSGRTYELSCIFVQGVQLKIGPYFIMSNLFTKIYNMLYYTTNLYLQ